MEKKQQIYFQNYIVHYDKSMKYPKGNFLNFRQLFHPQLQDQFSEEKVSAIFMIMGIQQEILEPLLQYNLQNALIFRQESDFPEDSQSIDERIKIIQIKKYTQRENNNKKYMQIYHPKIYIWKFKSFLRILIGTPNLCVGDWAVFNQVFYLKDFQKRKKNAENQNVSKFCQDLIYFLKKSLKDEYKYLQEFSGIQLEDYDIEQDQFIQLIWSLPGISFRNQYRTSGFFHFEQVIKNNQPEVKYNLKNTQLVYGSSSLGKIDIQFLRDLLLYLIPDLQSEPQIQEEDILKIVKIIYPDKEMMNKNEKLAQLFGNCLFNKTTNQNNKDAVNGIYYKCIKKSNYISKKEELFPHLKYIIIQNCEEINDDSIIYFGSHNCTSGAWGRVYGGTKIYNYNTELGIIMVPKKDSKEVKQEFLKNIIVETKNIQKYKSDDQIYTNYQQIIKYKP